MTVNKKTKAIVLVSLMVFSVITVSGVASAEIIRGTGNAGGIGNAGYDVNDGEGNVTEDAVVFQGEDDITLREFAGADPVPASTFSRPAEVGGETLSLPIPQDQAPGEYNSTGSNTFTDDETRGGGMEITVTSPQITRFDVNNNQTKINDGILAPNQTDATVLIEYNYARSENITLTIESENGVDVTNEFLASNQHDGAIGFQAIADTGSVNGSRTDNTGVNSRGVVAFSINPSGIDSGEYTFTAEGDDDFDFGEATQSTTVTVTGAQGTDIDPGDLPGDGTESDPYEIANASELQTMEDDLDANYELVSDIDASQTAALNNGSGFNPVGGADFRGSTPPPFTGSFEGNNHTVMGLIIDRPDKSRVGLFGESSGTVTDVTLTEVTVTGRNEVGGLIGDNRGTIQNATASGSVSGDVAVGGLVGRNSENITNARASGSVSGTDDVGGLVGDSFGVTTTIRNATASGSVTGGQDVGGLVGSNGGTIRDATASGSVSGRSSVGGLGGSNGGTIQNARASGSITGEFDVGDNRGRRVGGLIGHNFNGGTIRNAAASVNIDGRNTNSVGGTVGANDGNITDARASGSVTGNGNVGGLVGKNSEGAIQNARASGSVTGDTNVGGLVGTNTDEFGLGTIQDSFAVGPISGNANVGGLVGNNNQISGETGTVEQSYFDIEATGRSITAGSATGLTTVEMQGQAAAIIMTGLAFGTSWQTQTDPDDYPTLIALPQDTDQNQSQPDPAPTTSVSFKNQTVTNGSTTVTVESAQVGNQSVPGEDFVVVVHKTTSEGGIGTKIGESAVIEGNQTQSDITVNLSKELRSSDDVAQLTESQQLVAMLHTADTGDGNDINHGSNDLGENPPITARGQVAPLGLQAVDVNRTAINQPGQPVKITAEVANGGATESTIQFTLIDDPDRDNSVEVAILSVDSGQTETASFTVTPTQTETFSIQGPASTRSGTIDVANMSLVDATLATQEPVTTTDTVAVNVTVTNTGTATGFIPLTLTQNGTVANRTTQEVPAGETVTTQLTASLDSGTQNLTVASSLNNQSADAGETVVAPPGGVTNATVRVGSSSVRPGSTTDVNLTLDRAPQGLAGYNLTVSVSVAETSGVRVVDTSAPGVFNNSLSETTVGPANRTVEIIATDINTVVEANATDIPLGSVTVATDETADVSEGAVTVSVSRIIDDTGSPIDVETDNGTVSVTEQPPIAKGLNPPTDPDDDGVFEDIDGNGRLDFSDVVLLFENLRDAEAPFQDLNNNGRIEFDDIVELFQEI